MTRNIPNFYEQNNHYYGVLDMRFCKIFSATVVAGMLMLSSCTQSDLIQGTNVLATRSESASVEAPNGPKQITDPKEFAHLTQLLKSNRLNKHQKGSTIQGVSGATGSLSNVPSSGYVVNFTGSVSGVDTSDMILAGLRAFVEFHDVNGNTVAIWEYSNAYSNNGGFSEMTTQEKWNGSCTRVANSLSIPTNVTVAYISLYVWDRTQPSNHYQFLDWEFMTP